MLPRAPWWCLLLLGGCAADFMHEGLIDWDQDGFGAAVDCDDFDAAIHPFAGERCDGAVDEDCDGKVDDADDYVVDPRRFHRDRDGDGFGDPEITAESCAPPKGYVDDATDCDDWDENSNPAAEERCDPLDHDEDCDGLADDADESATGGTVMYDDADGDRYGDPATAHAWCDPGEGVVDDARDCDDTRKDVHPQALDRCNGLDDDCDGGADDDDPHGPLDPPLWYLDDDGDGYGASETAREACLPEAGEVERDGDCDESDPDVNPGATELCGDGVDQDCDAGGSPCVPTGDFEVVDARVWSVASGGQFGGATAFGDTDGNGLAEVWCGGAGAVALTGRLAGEASVTDRGLVEVTGGEGLGLVIAAGADLDGDGVDDLVLASASDDSGGIDAGAVYVFSGPVPTGTTEDHAVTTWVGHEASENAGSSVAVGDFDGDGAGDLFVGHPDAGSVVRGWLGPLPAGTATTLAWDVSAPDPSGGSVTLADLTGDGVDELVLGGGTGGTVTLLEGGVASGWLDASDPLNAIRLYDDALGFTVEARKDLDGDGLADLVVGSPAYDGERGLVWGFVGPFGPPDPSTGDAFMQIIGLDPGDRLGTSLAASGDLDDDGERELVVGAPGAAWGVIGDAGAVYLFAGNPGSGLQLASIAGATLHGTREGEGVGALVAVADLDGDGAADLVAGGEEVGPAAEAGALILYGSLR